MAAKNPAEDPGLAPDINNGTDFRGNTAYSMDMGPADKIYTCAACHSGGILEFDRDSGKRHDEAETWNNATDGTGWFSTNNYTDDQVDGDNFAYSQDELARGFIGKPHKFNWRKSGVLDTDCFLCHADRSQGKSVNNGMWTADNPTPANPRVFIFEKKDPSGNVVEISMGFPPKLTQDEAHNGYTIDSAAFYSDPLERLVANYYSDVIEQCMSYSGISSNPQMVQSFTIGVIANYLKHGQTSNITIPYSKIGGTNYTYNGSRFSNFFSTYFLDPGAPNFSARDYLRDAYFESTTQGQPYVGSGLFLRSTDMNDMFSYNPMGTKAPFVRLARAGFFFNYADVGSLMGIADPNDPSKPLVFVKLVKQSDGTFKAKAYYASDVDLSAVSLPILETEKKYTLCKADSASTDGVSKVHNGSEDKELSLMCAQCHFAIPDQKNRWYDPSENSHPSWYVRRGIIGLGADVVKRAAVYETNSAGIPTFVDQNGEMTDNAGASGLPAGYDVHFDKNKANLSCLSCHGQDNLSSTQKFNHNPHNFLKGNDPGGEVDPALDYNPSLQTCLKCHWGSDEAAAQAHGGIFAGHAIDHIKNISCQVCHIPYKTYFTFRFFDDTMGYSNQFDNRIRSFSFNNGNVTMQQFPPEWAVPAFGPSPTYGLNFSYVIAQTSDSGKDLVSGITTIDMDPYRLYMRYLDKTYNNGKNFKMWSNVVYPIRWAPVIVKRHYLDNGSDATKFGLISPITVATWVDATTGKALFVKEMNEAVLGMAKGNSTIDPEASNKPVPGLVMRPVSEAEAKTGKPAVSAKDTKGHDTGMVAAMSLINGKYIYDNNGDMTPEIDSNYEYEAMKDALKTVLDKEDPNHPHNPVIFLSIAPFGIDHGVWPANYALGSHTTGPLSCASCHNPDQSKDRLSPEVASGNTTAGRQIELVPFELPPEAIEESKAAGFYKVPSGLHYDKNGHMSVSQGDMVAEVKTPRIESKDYKGFFLISPTQSSTVSSNNVTVSVPAGAVSTPTALKLEKVDNATMEDSATNYAKTLGIRNPVLASSLLHIHTKDNSFAEPLTITLPYDASKVSGKVALLESEDGNSWKEIGEYGVNPSNPYVTFSTTKLSYFAIAGTASSSVAPSPTSPKTTSGGGGGGCSLAVAESPFSGIFNIVVMLAGLLGIKLGDRKRKE